jgi:hypothetical protein
LGTINDSFAAFFEGRRTKINKQAQWQIQKAKIGENLFGVNRRQVFHRFQFNQNKTIDQQVRPKSLFESVAPITDQNRLLTLHNQPLFLKHLGQHHLVNGFHQSRPQIAMQSVSAIHNNSSDLLLIPS